MFKIEKIADTNRFSALSINNYAASLHELHNAGFTPASIAQLAADRTHFGAYHEISWTGARTTDFFLFKNGKYYLAHADLTTPDKMAMIDALQDFNANRSEIPYVRGLLGKAIEVPLEDLAIPSQSLANHPIARFLLGKHVDTYSAWLQQAHIPLLPIALPTYSLVKGQEPFMRPLIMRCTDNWSGIITANADMHNLYGFRGDSTTWTGTVADPEMFNRQHLAAANKLVPLENRDYTLIEIERLLTDAGYAGLINGLLRFARNAGQHGLPANYDTFAN